MVMTKSQLRDALCSLASAHNKVKRLREKIHSHCMEVYGVDPADIDNDEFIDACDGGCGECAGMSAEEFDLSMKNSIKAKGIRK